MTLPAEHTDYGFLRQPAACRCDHNQARRQDCNGFAAAHDCRQDSCRRAAPRQNPRDGYRSVEGRTGRPGSSAPREFRSGGRARLTARRMPIKTNLVERKGNTSVGRDGGWNRRSSRGGAAVEQAWRVDWSGRSRSDRWCRGRRRRAAGRAASRRSCPQKHILCSRSRGARSRSLTEQSEQALQPGRTSGSSAPRR